MRSLIVIGLLAALLLAILVEFVVYPLMRYRTYRRRMRIRRRHKATRRHPGAE